MSSLQTEAGLPLRLVVVQRHRLLIILHRVCLLATGAKGLCGCDVHQPGEREREGQSDSEYGGFAEVLGEAAGTLGYDILS